MISMMKDLEEKKKVPSQILDDFEDFEDSI